MHLDFIIHIYILRISYTYINIYIYTYFQTICTYVEGVVFPCIEHYVYAMVGINTCTYIHIALLFLHLNKWQMTQVILISQ